MKAIFNISWNQAPNYSNTTYNLEKNQTWHERKYLINYRHDTIPAQNANEQVDN